MRQLSYRAAGADRQVARQALIRGKGAIGVVVIPHGDGKGFPDRVRSNSTRSGPVLTWKRIALPRRRGVVRAGSGLPGCRIAYGLRFSRPTVAEKERRNHDAAIAPAARHHRMERDARPAPSRRRT